MVVLVGKKKFFSTNKNQWFYQLHVLTKGNDGEGSWCETQFVSEKCYLDTPESDFGKTIEDYVWGSDPNRPNSRFPSVVGYKIKNK